MYSVLWGISCASPSPTQSPPPEEETLAYLELCYKYIDSPQNHSLCMLAPSDIIQTYCDHPQTPLIKTLCSNSTHIVALITIDHISADIAPHFSAHKHIKDELALKTNQLNRCLTHDSTQRESCLKTALRKTYDWISKLHNRIISIPNQACTKEWSVAIDIGHDPIRSGAKSARGLKEYDFNKTLAQLTAVELEKRQLQIVWLNTEEKKLSLRSRTRKANRAKVDIFLSIHHDSVQEHYLQDWTFQSHSLRYCDKFSGFSLFYSNRSQQGEQSLVLASALGKALTQQGWKPTPHHAEPIKGENRTLVYPDLGVYRRDNLGVLRTALMPAVLFEAGVLPNRDEELRLRDPIEQQLMAATIAHGIAEFCNQP